MSTDLRTIAAQLRSEGLRCNCDLDNWEPEQSTGHSWVCRIHNAALAMQRDLPLHTQGVGR